jgi:hypothetical protein
MGFIGNLLRVLGIVFEEEPDENTPEDTKAKLEEIGKKFEDYIQDLIFKNNGKREYFALEYRTPDYYDAKSGIYAESNLDPDFRIRYNPTGDVFAVECKYRSGYAKDNQGRPILSWSKPAQFARYQKYQQERNIPVYVVIGLGGEPDNPEMIYCIPLSEIKYPQLYPSVLKKYEHPPTELFFWNTKEKKLG